MLLFLGKGVGSPEPTEAMKFIQLAARQQAVAELSKLKQGKLSMYHTIEN